MMKRVLTLFLGFVLTFSTQVRADEGMWLPFLINEMNIGTMTELGFKLTAEDIYSLNNASLKDAVIALDHGSCSGELLSPDGLFLTNHHCGYGEIQAHSTPEHNYLQDGFWAMSRAEELPNPEKTVSFLIRIEDVTAKINAKLSNEMREEEREAIIAATMAQLEKEAVGDTHYEAVVETFFEGNQFFLFVYETFRDVRLVGAPPSSIGKFGGDTDNWMWPRHTGDFSMFRIYCGPDGKPADFSEENVPYHPKHYFPISIKGVEEGDFAMVMGYPGSTDRYATSWGVKETMEIVNPIRVYVRTIKQEIMKADMDASETVDIQYASKYSQSANYWKYSIGQNKGLEALNVIGKKQAIEKDFFNWLQRNAEAKAKYGNALQLIEDATNQGKNLQLAWNYWLESVYFGSEIIQNARDIRILVNTLENEPDNTEKINQIVEYLKSGADELFKDYNAPTDQKITAALFKIYFDKVDAKYHLGLFKNVKNNDFDKFAATLVKKSIFADKTRYLEFLKNPSMETLEKDWGYQLLNEAFNIYSTIQEEMSDINYGLGRGKRMFVGGLLEMNAGTPMYPDANSTMRLTYGTVGGYRAADAVFYEHYTTLDGYIEKENPNSDEFEVPAKLKQLWAAKDYGRWGKDGVMNVCFLTNNDITGGNSGSPVINANGELIGCAFDGNWEAMSGDIAYESELQRTICVDIRYVLFIIDKYAGASHLIQEMKIVE